MATTPEPPKEAQFALSGWGSPQADHRAPPKTDNSMPPAGLATLITALHFRPFQLRPIAFVPILLFSSYINLQGFKKDAAGISAAASGTYALLALRRNPGGLFKKLSIRGGVRAAAVGLAVANTLGGGWVYATASREKEQLERQENPRWA